MLMLARLRAGSPDDAVRDPDRALSLALRLTPPDALIVVETRAMAEAALGRFDEAVRWQRAALAAVREQGLSDLEPRVAARLARYEGGLPVGEVWLREESAGVRVRVALPAQSGATPDARAAPSKGDRPPAATGSR